MKAIDRILILLTTITVSVSACSKGSDAGAPEHEVNNDDSIPPTIVINTPASNQVYTAGQSVMISGRLTDNAGLYRGSIKITRDDNNAVIKEQIYEIHGYLLYDFNLTEVISAPADYTITVRFEDHGYNTASKSVKIKVNP